MCGQRARTNFPATRTGGAALSASLVAKLEKCGKKESRERSVNKVTSAETAAVGDAAAAREGCSDEECIEQMIEELLYCGSVEISPSYCLDAEKCS